MTPPPLEDEQRAHRRRHAPSVSDEYRDRLRPRISPAVWTGAVVIGLALLAAAVRFSLRTIESRWQLLAFATLAAVSEFLYPRFFKEGSPSITRVMFLILTAGAVILLVKLYVEPGSARSIKAAAAAILSS